MYGLVIEVALHLVSTVDGNRNITSKAGKSKFFTSIRNNQAICRSFSSQYLPKMDRLIRFKT